MVEADDSVGKDPPPFDRIGRGVVGHVATLAGLLVLEQLGNLGE